MDLSRRGLLIGASASLLWPGLDALAAPLTYDLKAEQIAPNTFVIIGKKELFSPKNGGNIVNIAFIDTEDGVVLIDTGPCRRYAAAVNELIKSVTGKSVIRVYITHFHPDHCLGNQIFNPKDIAATKEVIDGMKVSGEGFSANLYRLIGDWMRGTEVVIPEHVIKASSEKFGSHRFEMLPLKGHTNSDLAIYDHKTGVLFAGDLCFLDRAATTPHANIADWQKSLKELKSVPHKILFPGHGEADINGRAIEQTDAYITWLNNSLVTSVKQGKDMIEAANIPIPAQFSSISLVTEELERSVSHIYPDLEENLLPFVGQGG